MAVQFPQCHDSTRVNVVTNLKTNGPGQNRHHKPTSIANCSTSTEMSVAPTASSPCRSRTAKISYVMCVLRLSRYRDLREIGCTACAEATNDIPDSMLRRT